MSILAASPHQMRRDSSCKMETPRLPTLHAFEPSPLPMTHLSSFIQQSPTLTLAQIQADNTDRARAYKSRNKRPCDFCRYKKAACHLDSQPPCELCIRYNKDCTFVESPAKRRRPNDSSGNSDERKSVDIFEHPLHGKNGVPGTPFASGEANGGGDFQQELLGWAGGLPPFQMPIGPDFSAFDPALYQEPVTFETFEPMSASTATGEMMFNNSLGHCNHSSIDTSPLSNTANLQLPIDLTSGEPSLDDQAFSNAQIVGISGESDPFLLSRYRYDEYNEAAFQSLRMRKMTEEATGERSIPTFFTIAHNALAAKAQPLERPETMDRYRCEVGDMVNDEVGKRLIRLFYKYVQPFFPLLTREGRQERDETGVREPSSVSTCVLAAIYGHALSFCAWDEKLCVEVYRPPSADALFRIAWLACLPMLHTPSLAVLQTLLLLVQRRPTNKHVSDTPMKWTMMSMAVSVAQALGVNRDPTNWALPSWEIKVRKRLGWATFVQDKWLALNFGRSSHIQADDWDVEPLTEQDFTSAEREGPDALAGYSGQHFIKLCELTLITDDIIHNLFSLRATKALHGSLEATLEVAKPLRIRLTEWFQSLPIGLLPRPSSGSPDTARRRSGQHELEGNGSLYLAYITAKIELFRAMLRPRVTDSNAVAVSALRTGALAVAKEVFEFLESLHAQELEAFWASYARSNFTIASSFMLLLFVTSPTLSDAQECLALLNAWRSLLRIKSRSCDLLNLALLRLDGVYVAGMERLIELSPAAAQAWGESRQGKS